MRIALAGNPNCGKTTLFNALTGSNQYVGNWPGVTVDRKEGRLRGDREKIVVDLPGIYSLSPYSPEEVIARRFLAVDRPDVICNIIDGTNFERNLYLTTQLAELGIPMVVAINMADLMRRNKTKVDIDKLEREMECRVIEISASKGEGIEELVEAITSPKLRAPHPLISTFGASVESALTRIEQEYLPQTPLALQRWYAIKLFERDVKIHDDLKLDDAQIARIDRIVGGCEKEMDDGAESIITAARYDTVEQIVERCVRRPDAGMLSASDKIDRVVTNRWLGLPIFAVVMFLVYFLAVTTVGGWATDWANDGVFGDGWFLGPGDAAYSEVADAYTNASDSVSAFETAAIDQGLDPESETFIDDATTLGIVTAFDTYDEDTGENVTTTVDSDTYVDALATVAEGEPDPHDYGIYVTGIPALVSDGLMAIDAADWLQDLLVNGIIAGVGAVLGFVPQLLVLFLLLALLESCGYMARIAFVLDRVFRRFGLSGKSFVPILIGTGCGVPGIMASRTIENENDRRMTVMTTTFIPCSAKLPIIALLAGAVFGGVWWIAPSAYFLGIASILCSGIILKKTKMFSGEGTPFVMELPSYHVPKISAVLRSMWERTSAFLRKAGTVILLATIVVWFLSGYGFADGTFGAVADNNDSMLAVLAGAISWVFYPLGWGQWQPVAATITGLIAKENVVGTFGILYAGDVSWYAALQAAFTPLVGYSLLAFNLLCAPCVAAMGAIRREMGSARWFWRAIGYQCGLAYCVSLVIYQVVGLSTGEVGFGAFTILAFLLVAWFVYLLVRPQKDWRKRERSATSAEATEAV